MTYERPTISASRLKAIGGEKGVPGCERKLAGAYLFGMKQSGSDATEFGTALHALAEHHQDTGAILAPESDVGRVYSAGAHVVTAAGPLLVEHEHIGELPDGSPYVAYIDGHSPRVGNTNALVIQDLKTTSNPAFALQGATPEIDDTTGEMVLREATARGPYALREDIQGGFYAWILLAAPPHWFAPTLPDGVLGPRHWQWWDPAERGVRDNTRGRLRWVYFLTRGTPRSWEVNDWVTPAMAAAYLTDQIMPLVARINALHEWFATRAAAGGTPPTLDEIDRTLEACRDPRRNTFGRWCGVGERDACNYDQLGTPALDLVQLRVRKQSTMTPQERLAALRNKNNPTNAGGNPGLVAAAPVQEAPAASPPPVTAAPGATDTKASAPVAPSTASAVVAVDNGVPAEVTAAPVTELTKGQKAAATRAAKKGAAVPPVPAGGVNPPEVTEALAKLTAPLAQLAGAPGAGAAPTTCPPAADLLALLAGLAAELPPGVSVTLTGGLS